QNINNASEVVLEELPARSRSIQTSQHAWICSGVNNPIDFWKSFEIAAVTDITMKNDPTEFFKDGPVCFGSRSHEVVDTTDRHALHVRKEVLRHSAADKATNASN